MFYLIYLKKLKTSLFLVVENILNKNAFGGGQIIVKLIFEKN